MGRESSKQGWTTTQLDGEDLVHFYPTVEFGLHNLRGTDCSCGPAIAEKVVTHRMRLWTDVYIPDYPPEEAQP